jgi:hypothetical protein
MAKDIIAPSIVQNLNMASDLYGDRSNIRNPYDLGVQIFTVDASNNFLPQRTVNTHLLNGETEKRPGVGTDFVATFNWSSFLPKGFASDQFYYAVTGISMSAVAFGKVTVGTPAAPDVVMSTSGLQFDNAALGFGAAAQAINCYPGQVLGTVFRSTMATAWAEYRQDGRKTSFVFDHLLNIPGVTQMNDAAANGLSLQSNRALLPVPFLLSPRNTNQSQEVVVIHFELDSAKADADAIADITATAAEGDEYALVYKLDFSGYFCDAQGNPADQEFTLANARLAADYRPVGA